MNKDEQVMTVKDAREILKGALVFGDEKQIEAVRLVELAALVSDQRLECSECDGAGESECYECGHERECPECKGTGEVTFSAKDIDAMDAHRIALIEKSKKKVGHAA